MMFWDKGIEGLSRDEMSHMQGDRLKRIVKYAYEKVKVYTQKFDEKGIDPADVRTVDDISSIPFTTKSDLREHYPYGLCAVPYSDIVRVHASSGTT